MQCATLARRILVDVARPYGATALAARPGGCGDGSWGRHRRGFSQSRADWHLLKCLMCARTEHPVISHPGRLLTRAAVTRPGSSRGPARHARHAGRRVTRAGSSRGIDDPARAIRGQRVALLDRRADRGAALGGRLLTALDRLGLARERVVLHLVAEPPRV